MLSIFTLLLLPTLTFQAPSLPHTLRSQQVLNSNTEQISTSKSNISALLNCSIKTYLATGTPWIKWAEPLPDSAWSERRDALARALAEADLDAFVAEPGDNQKFFSGVEWEGMERPMLMVIQPTVHAKSGKIVADTTFLVAGFERHRLELLTPHLPGFEETPGTVVWQEDESPFEVLLNSSIWRSTLDFRKTAAPKIMIDGEIRDFISRGLSNAGFEVEGFGGDVERVRQRKTKGEIEILRAVNTGTVAAVRSMRECLVPGLTVHQVQHALHSTLLAGNFTNPTSIVEFGEEAASPHGGFSGDKKLESGDLVLIDVDAYLYGYASDITRTFFPPFVPKPRSIGGVSGKMLEQLEIWYTVHRAQDAAVAAMRSNVTAASVDVAAREVIEKAGYGEWFLHRLGHSIGTQIHESPYLNKGNTKTILKPGMVFTAEPGIYIWEKVGVRLEDVILVKKDGEAECLSCGFDNQRAVSPWEI